MRDPNGPGFSLMETAVTLALVSALLAGMIGMAGTALDTVQRDRTDAILSAFQDAITGDPVIVYDESRHSFGFIGDMGRLPASLEELWNGSGLPVYTFDTDIGMGAGWNGPYLDPGILEYEGALTEDGWGNALFYATVPFTESLSGAGALARLVSSGPNRTLDDNDDRTAIFYEAELVSLVQGRIVDALGTPLSGVPVTLHFPDDGVAAELEEITDEFGYYAFESVPYGKRSLTPNPRLVLTPETAEVSGAGNNDVDFDVSNYGTGDIEISSVRVDYSASPPAYFSILRVDGSNKYSDTTPRLPAGSLISFPGDPETVLGTGVPNPSTTIHVQSPVTWVDDLVIGAVGAGDSITISFDNFNTSPDGGGGDTVDMSGIVFNVTINEGDSDESLVVFVPVIP